jgi:hypothetical protein
LSQYDKYLSHANVDDHQLLECADDTHDDKGVNMVELMVKPSSGSAPATELTKSVQSSEDMQLSVTGVLGTRLAVFWSPLAMEVVQRMVDAAAQELTRQHPVYVVQQLFW